MAGATTGEFAVADHLDSSEEIAAYLDAVLEDGDDKLLLVALRHVVKSWGFAKAAQGAGLRRETLYQSFSTDGNPLAEEFLPKNTLPKISLSFIVMSP